MSYAKKIILIATTISILVTHAPKLTATDNMYITTALNLTGRISACYAGAAAGSLIHELGHASVGSILGAKLSHICIGTNEPGDKNALISSKYITINRPLSLHPKPGGVTYFSDSISPKKMIAISAGGPLLGLITTAIAWQFAEDNPTAKFLLTANAFNDLSNLVPTLTNFWDFISDNGENASKRWKSDGDQFIDALKEVYNVNLKLRSKLENTAAGRITLLALDMGLKILPLYYYGRTIFHR